jgi:hypothetical protein
MGARISLTPEIGFILLFTDDLLVVRSLVKDKSYCAIVTLAVMMLGALRNISQSADSETQFSGYKEPAKQMTCT